MKPHIQEFGSFKEDFSFGSHKLVRAWKNTANLKKNFFTTLFINIFSWGMVASAWNSPISINGGVQYSSMADALTKDMLIWGMFIFPVISTCLAYHTLAIFLNRTVISFHEGVLSVAKGPLPWPQSLISIPREDIRHAYVKEYTPYTEGDVPVIKYQFLIQRRSVGDTVIESGLPYDSDARILEKWIEKNIPSSTQPEKKVA